ncbi:MAG: NAD(P)H-dependent oxidoreductase [Agarilytica sp.]
MTQVLRIDSSLFGPEGVSHQLNTLLIEHITKTFGNVNVTARSLSSGEIPHFTYETIAAIGAGKAALADALIEEVQAADIIVLGAPMYNFGIPSELKAWFDHIARAKVTFEYTANGPVGLLKNKKVYVVATRGGIHKDQSTDTETPFLKTILSFVGLDDVEFIYAEGLNMGEGIRDKAIREAEQHINALFDNAEASA